MAVKVSVSAAPAGTVLAFDFGTRRIGVAVGETLVGVAHPLGTIANRPGNACFEEVARLVAEWRPSLLLVGLPTHADGTPHAMTARSRAFASKLRGRFALPVAFGDERFTTQEASYAMRGIRTHKRKSARDPLSAQILLQAYLDHASAS